MELLFLTTTLTGIGVRLQGLRRLGRLGFVKLYMVGGLCSSLTSLLLRHSASGCGGALASCCFHSLAEPYARHRIYGLEMGSMQALAVQLGLASLPALSEGSNVIAILAINAVPALVGAVAFYYV